MLAVLMYARLRRAYPPIQRIAGNGLAARGYGIFLSAPLTGIERAPGALSAVRETSNLTNS